MSQDKLLEVRADHASLEATRAATQHDIDYSVKIGKQVLLKKLKERSEALRKDYRAAEEAAHDFRRLEHPKLTKIIEKEFWLNIKNCSQINTLRLAMNAFLDKGDKITTNKKMVNWESCRNATSSSPTESGHLRIQYGLEVAVNPLDYRQDSSSNEWENTFSLELEIPDILKGYWREYGKLEKVASDLNELINETDLKIKNINSVMEEVEANLLIKEMQKSSRGEEVLEMTNNILADVLGDAPLVLESK